ncbi:MAG: DUF305 domain-containing protein [Luteimonas sp.]
MNIKTSLLAVTLAAASLLAFSVGAHEPKPQAQDMKGHAMKGMDMKGMDMKGHSAGSMEMHKIMMSGMKMPMKMTGNVDKDFALMMSMHHQQAIKMVDVLIKHGSSTELKALARKMKTAQQAEIRQMTPYTK